MEISETVQCPCYGQTFELVVDTSVRSERFATDCEVCCRPFEVVAECEPGEVLSVEVVGGRSGVDLPCVRRSGQVRLRCEEWPGNLRESHRGLAGVDDLSSDGGDLGNPKMRAVLGMGWGLILLWIGVGGTLMYRFREPIREALLKLRLDSICKLKQESPHGSRLAEKVMPWG